MHASARVCEPRLLYHGESLDVSGQFICDSDERRGGDGLSVIWLTEQWWIIPATLSPPRRAANDFIGRAVMTCDGCCFGRRPHFCLLSGCLSAFMSRSVDGALCFSTIRPGCVWTWTQCEISSSSLLLAFASASLMPRRHFGAIFLYFVLTSSVFFSWQFPLLVLPFLLLCSSHLRWPFCRSLPSTSVSFPFTLSTLFRYLPSVRSPPSPTLRCLFVPSSPPSPSALIPSVSLALIFPRFSSTFAFALSSSASDHFSSALLIHPSIHLTLCHFVLAVWPGRSHQAAVRPSVHGAHQDRPDARLQRRLHVGRRSRSNVEPHRGGWLFRSPLQHTFTIPSNFHCFFNPVLLEGVSCNFRQNSDSISIITQSIQDTRTWNTNSDVSRKQASINLLGNVKKDAHFKSRTCQIITYLSFTSVSKRAVYEALQVKTFIFFSGDPFT